MSTNENDADLEYGPTPDDAEYEHTDIEPSIAAKFAVWLGVALLISIAIVYGTFWLFEGQEKNANRAAQIFPLAAGQTRAPQGPRLQTQPFKDIYQLRDAEHEKLTTYGWVDQGTGVVRIPIEDALRIMSERGAAAPSPPTPNGLNQVTQDSSSGRTAVPR
jgi:hypothetical protein